MHPAIPGGRGIYAPRSIYAGINERNSALAGSLYRVIGPAMRPGVGQLGLVAETMDTGLEVLAAASHRTPTLVVLDIELAEPTGYEVCRELREQFGETFPIVFVAGASTQPRDEIAGLLLGADDYFPSPLGADRFLARVRRLVTRAPAPSEISPLTEREHEVLGLLIDGRRPAGIAERLCITRKTVSTHIEHILGKLGAHSQAEAVAIALREGFAQHRRTLREPAAP
jgi:DNA-binding NarL/FixJ family response regulator